MREYLPKPVAPALQANPAALLALQRGAGNHAVARLLSRSPAPGPIPPKQDDEWLDLETIREETKAEILTAFPVFCDACDANVTAMKAAAKANAEAATLFIDASGGGVQLHGFVEWVPSFLEAEALTKEKEENGGDPPVIAYEDITGSPGEPPD